MWAGSCRNDHLVSDRRPPEARHLAQRQQLLLVLARLYQQVRSLFYTMCMCFPPASSEIDQLKGIATTSLGFGCRRRTPLVVDYLTDSNLPMTTLGQRRLFRVHRRETSQPPRLCRRSLRVRFVGYWRDERYDRRDPRRCSKAGGLEFRIRFRLGPRRASGDPGMACQGSWRS